MGESNFDILTWNVRGLLDYGKRRKIFNWIKKHTSKEAIVLLQETHSTEIIEKQWEQFFFSNLANKKKYNTVSLTNQRPQR